MRRVALLFTTAVATRILQFVAETRRFRLYTFTTKKREFYYNKRTFSAKRVREN